LGIAWCLKNKNVTSVIIGASTPVQARENIQAIGVVRLLTDEIMLDLDRVNICFLFFFKKKKIVIAHLLNFFFFFFFKKKIFLFQNFLIFFFFFFFFFFFCINLVVGKQARRCV
jgi:hypothetical protein